jgi:hypothetical protein
LSFSQQTAVFYFTGQTNHVQQIHLTVDQADRVNRADLLTVEQREEKIDLFGS